MKFKRFSKDLKEAVGEDTSFQGSQIINPVLQPIIESETGGADEGETRRYIYHKVVEQR